MVFLQLATTEQLRLLVDIMKNGHHVGVRANGGAVVGAIGRMVLTLPNNDDRAAPLQVTRRC